MTAKRNADKIELTPEQKAKHAQIRELFRGWHPSPEELIASESGKDFAVFGEYPYLRPFLAEMKRAREEAGLSLADVSSRCGIDKAALSRLENNQNSNPTLDTLWRYSAALGKRLLLQTSTIVPSKRSKLRGKPASRNNRKPVGKR